MENVIFVQCEYYFRSKKCQGFLFFYVIALNQKRKECDQRYLNISDKLIQSYINSRQKLATENFSICICKKGQGSQLLRLVF